MSAKKKILLLHTGGTLGMGLTGKPKDQSSFINSLKQYAPQIFEIADIYLEILFNKDSSNIVPGDWSAIATTLDAKMDDYDAFIVIHGTDTMAFSASAISFMISNPKKPIIFTGSQRPLVDARSDAPRNLVYAVELACEARFKEICIFFDSVLLRGNRSKKTSIPSFGAFESPNFPPLAKVGVSTEFTPHQIFEGPYSFDPRVHTQVFTLTLAPGAPLPPPQFFIDSQISALLVQAFGPGDIPSKDGSEALELLEFLKEKNLPVILCSQAIQGRVDPELYEAGRKALEKGAISALDMTWESALSKTMILLGRRTSFKDFPTAIHKPIAGELSP